MVAVPGVGLLRCWPPPWWWLRYRKGLPAAISITREALELWPLAAVVRLASLDGEIPRLESLTRLILQLLESPRWKLARTCLRHRSRFLILSQVVKTVGDSLWSLEVIISLVTLTQDNWASSMTIMVCPLRVSRLYTHKHWNLLQSTMLLIA